MILEKIANRTARVGVIGLGYVGLPLTIAIATAGYRVTGIDICSEKIDRLKQGISDVPDVPNTALAPLLTSGQVELTTDFRVLRGLDTVNICVPTPLGENRTPDLQFITAAATQVAKYLHPEQLIILESTTYPGTTEEVLLPILSGAGAVPKKQVGRDFYLAYSPERIEPGNTTYAITNTPKIVGGITPDCTRIAERFYAQFINKTYTVSSPGTAEMVKLLENTFRSVNIGLINEVALICDRMGLDVWEIIAAAATKPFGFMPFYPGPGPGGHCIPIDPHYLSWKARLYEYHARFIELATEINAEMPKYVVDKIIDALNRNRKPLNGAKLLIIGVAYKKDIADTRESPAVEVIRLILDKKAEFLYHDPYVDTVSLDTGDTYYSEPLTSQLVENADCVVILTDHTAVDYEWLVRHAQCLVDTRNATAHVKEGREKITKI